VSALRFEVTAVRPAIDSLSPVIAFRLQVTNLENAPVHAIALRCQVQIEARPRRYTEEEASRLYQLFGAPSEWGRTLRTIVWAQTSTVIGGFDRQTDVELHVPCTYDLCVAAAAYLHGVRDADVPLSFMFSGTTFRNGAEGLSIEPVSWDSEARFRMSPNVWQQAMDQLFPGAGWIVMSRETIDALQAFKDRRAMLTWDDAMMALLHAVPAEQAS